MMKPFLDAIDDGVLVCDGAMGTMLYAKGVFINKSFDALNVTQPDLVAEVHQEYVRAGADIVETNAIGAAIDAVRSVSDLPIVAQMSTEEDGNTLDGTPPEKFAPELEKRGATIIGVNCAVGPAPMLDTIERMAAVTTRKLSAQPNAGQPRDVEGRNIYLCSPDYMASYARRCIMHN